MGPGVDKGSYIVVDIGKTLAKLTLWSAEGRCLLRLTNPNRSLANGDYLALDIEGVARWLTEALAQCADHPVEYIVPVAHGAGVVAIDRDGIVIPPLDYEYDIPDQFMAAYRNQRDAFAETGSPALPLGLNLGAQLAYLEALRGTPFRHSVLLPYAQYWAWFLSGQARSEVTSLGCHTDLWSPAARDWSPMARHRGWSAQFAPLAHARDIAGTLREDLARQTGLPPSVKICTGLHDSNAALLAARGYDEIRGADSTVLSTGTWFVAMRTPLGEVDLPALPENRDCLVNVDVDGQPVPTARFMGGREIETRIQIDTRRIDIRPDQPALLAAIPTVIDNDAMLLPGFAPGCGPFPKHEGRWVNQPADWIEQRAATSLYAALVADTSLGLIGARDIVLVEGRFAEAEVFVRGLASLRPDLRICVANKHNDVSFGALRLLDPALEPDGGLEPVVPLDVDIAQYRDAWRERVA